MVSGLSNNQAVSQLFQNNQADAQNGQYQKMSGPNDGADKTAALALNTENKLDNGLINALDQSVANLNKNIQANGDTGVRYNGNGHVASNVHKTGDILSKII